MNRRTLWSMLAVSLVALLAACPSLGSIESADDVQFERIRARAVFLSDYAGAKLVREEVATCAQVDAIADRIASIASEAGDVGAPGGITAEFLESLGLQPEDVSLVLYVVGEIKAELGIGKLELAGPRLRSLLVSMSDAARCGNGPGSPVVN